MAFLEWIPASPATPNAGSLRIDFQRLAQQLARNYAEALKESFGAREVYTRRAVDRIATEFPRQLQPLANRARAAAITAYLADFGSTRLGPTYKRQNRLSGAMLDALNDPSFVTVTNRSILYGNRLYLDNAAAHWRRLNFGAGGKGAATYQARSFPTAPSRSGTRAFSGSLRITGGPSPGFEMPRGVFSSLSPSEPSGRLGRTTTGTFYPNYLPGRETVPTAGIGASQFLDAGVEALADGMNQVVENVVAAAIAEINQFPDQYTARRGSIR